MNQLEIGLIKFKNQLNRVFPTGKTRFFSSAIITAAGSSNRMGGVSKQLMNLNGKPCILYSLLAFQQCDDVDEIIVVTKEEEAKTVERICYDYNVTKLAAIVPGGNTRQESVTKGFLALSKHSDFVAIHDAARPLILSSHVSALIQAAKKWGASCAARRMIDTVKKATEQGFIVETVPRDDLYTVQTPQVFKADLYRVALALAEKNGISVTDDCALAEHAGFLVKLCELGAPNMKLTTPEDVSLIEQLLKEREHG